MAVNNDVAVYITVTFICTILNILNLGTLPTQRIYVFCTDLETNSDSFPKHQQPFCVCKEDREFTARGELIFVLFKLISGFTDVPSLRQSVAVLSPRRSEFDSSPDYAEFMVDKTMGQVSLRVLRLPPVTTIPPMLHIHLHLNTILIIRTSGRNVVTIKQSNFLPDIGK
jgi:hypothetical protein